MTVHLWSSRQRNVFYFLLERHGSNPDGRRMSLGDRRERPQEQVHRRRLAGQRLEIQGTWKTWWKDRNFLERSKLDHICSHFRIILRGCLELCENIGGSYIFVFYCFFATNIFLSLFMRYMSWPIPSPTSPCASMKLMKRSKQDLNIAIEHLEDRGAGRGLKNLLKHWNMGPLVSSFYNLKLCLPRSYQNILRASLPGHLR